jgi:hypothetical protein
MGTRIGGLLAAWWFYTHVSCYVFFFMPFRMQRCTSESGDVCYSCYALNDDFPLPTLTRDHTCPRITEAPNNLLIKYRYKYPTQSIISYLTLGNTGLRPTASATHPPIKQSPPSGVTGPINLNRCGSSTSRYILPLNMVMPAVRSDIAMVFCGAATAASVRTAEWMSCCRAG